MAKRIRRVVKSKDIISQDIFNLEIANNKLVEKVSKVESDNEIVVNTLQSMYEIAICKDKWVAAADKIKAAALVLDILCPKQSKPVNKVTSVESGSFSINIIEHTG